ncbi:MAG: sulfatase-like hydrolase/transferase, partial [Pseudomonadales bacterium]
TWLGNRLAPTRSLGARIAPGATTVILCALYFDGRLYELYGFHVNGFVWNLVITPGGLESLGLTGATLAAAAAVCAALLAAESALLRLTRRLPEPPPAPGAAMTSCMLLIVLTASERLYYGFQDQRANAAVLAAAARLPGYQPLTYGHWLTAHGIARTRHHHGSLTAASGRLQYPRAPLIGSRPDVPPNIVVLVAESWRADTLTARIMPATTRFAAHAINYRQHYSGGNGTRMGLFTLFYGMDGSYWQTILDERRPPLLLRRLNDLGYRFLAQTAARFSYPEFDATIFSGLQADRLHEDSAGPTWLRDRSNVARGIDWMRAVPDGQPFFYFQFFESPHAPYAFPPEATIEPDYVRDVNYLDITPDADLTRLRHRYDNSVHHLDQQFARLFEYLETSGRLADTLVVVTGDHGEEFNENGHWGHNSEFSQPQVRVPLILRIPGRPPAQVTRISSHIDLVATLMPLLGVRNPTMDYSTGHNLLPPGAGDGRRAVTLADWSRIAWVGT